MKTGIEYIGSLEHRAFDLLGSLLLAIPSVPVAAAAAIAIKSELGGASSIMRQRRVGMHGSTFDLFKLRTFLDQLADGSNDIGGSEHPLASPRAKLIRKKGLDEVPQLANVICGDMHLVGLRPQLPEVLEERAEADKGLFNDWYWWYERNIGILGDGQAYAHGFGTYNENSSVVCEVMRLDIAGCESASIATQTA